ncbi:MAG: shikimate kinase [Acidimicrobiia bacterium]
MPLWLVGMMGSGKSTVGRLLAFRLSLQFLDIDEMVEDRAGRSIADIFTQEGEPGFRRRESDAIELAAQAPGAVIATGGGAVLSPANVALMTGSGKVVWLRAEPAVLAQRLGDGRGRPLLVGSQTPAWLAELLAERLSAFRAVADHVIDTDQVTAEEVASMVEKLCSASG